MEHQKILPKRIIIDGDALNTDPAAAFRGLGCVTGNGSSRLLLDYKHKHPEVYEELLRLLFKPGCGAGLTHIKVELGADINSSSGTEPCTKRTADEPADVTRGAGFRLAADAKRINPALSVDLLRWGEPHWVTAAFAESREAGYAARFRWYYETLTAAYHTYGLEFDHISPDANEPEHADTDWLIYFSEQLRTQKDAPYDMSRIRLVASDEVGSRTIAAEMLQNERLRNAIDVIGLHYTTHGDENTRRLHEEFHKEIWYSEGIAPCNVPALSRRVDGSGLSGSNGPLDVANRIINSYANGRMVMYEFQPAVAAYYDGSCYSPKQLITANTPWSGHYSVDIGLWIAAHFTRFAAPGWLHADAACFGDGEENHSIWNTTHNYMSLISPDRQHMTVHLCNDSDSPRSYVLVLRNLPELSDSVSMVQTAGAGEKFPVDRNWLRVVQELRLHRIKGEAAIPVIVKPHSLLTVTTMDVSEICGTAELTFPVPEPQRLPLPYQDSLRRSEEFIRARGGAPLYMTDQGGAFELVSTQEGSFLEQQITKDALPTNWRFRGTPEPLTCFGDDTWANYQAGITAEFAGEDADNYVGIGIRYNSAVTCPETSACGLQLRLYADGRWQMRYLDEVLHEDTVPDYTYDTTHQIGIAAMGNLVLCFADGHSVYETRLELPSLIRSGRCSLQSAYYKNRFTDLTVKELPFPMPVYCQRIDCLAEPMQYLQDEESVWVLQGMAGYQFYNRTCALGSEGSEMRIRFYGTGISMLGRSDEATAAFWLDGKLYADAHRIHACHYREAFFTVENLRKGWHTLHMLITDGTIDLDAAEIPADDGSPEYLPAQLPTDPQAEEPERPKRGLNLRKAAVPIAGAAAAGLAVAFAVGSLMKKKKKK